MKTLVGQGKPFHSAVDKTAALLKRKVGTGAEFMKELMGVSGIKPTELQERGLTDIMGMPKMTHDQFMAALGKKPAPKIREKVLGGDRSEPDSEAPYHEQDYTLPGGDNYREMLIKAPQEKGYKTPNGQFFSKEELNDPIVNKTAKKVGLSSAYRPIGEQYPGNPNHFGGEPGILASMRLKDRTGPNGEKLLHLEELQSDWHQQGRDKGYKIKGGMLTPEENTRLNDLYLKSPSEMTDEEHKDFMRLTAKMPLSESENIANKDRVPDAPFKKNWEEMALKRLIHHAAEKGYHGIVVTPGAEQAKRYNIGNHIGQLNADEYDIAGDRQWRINAKDKSGNKVSISNQYLTDEELAGHVGKELANKIITDRGGEYSGLDLHVGGEGMKGFYDKKVPNILNSIGKKYGVKTELHAHPIETGREQMVPDNAGLGTIRSGNPEYAQAHHFPITEEMRKDVLTNGLPLYAQGGIIHKAEGGSMDTPDLAQSRLNINQRANPALMDNIGINEALDMNPKTFINPDPKIAGSLPVGGVDKVGGLPIGGVDQSSAPGMQFAPQQGQQGQPDQQGGLPQMGQPPSAGPSAPPHPSNILSLTPQGRALGAMAPQGMATGGSAKQRAQARIAMEKQMVHLADGGQPPKRRTFAIQPANQAPKTETQFTPYDPEKISIKNLARAFDEAISHHLSLSHEDRIANSAKAAKIVGGYIGLNHEGKTKDLLGKNAKLLKTEEGKGEEPIQLPDGRGVETTGLALAPAYEEAGFNTCPNSASCKKECLGKTSGNYFKLGGGSDLDEFEGPRLNSLNKTQAFLHDPHAFAVRLHDEIQAAKDMAGANENHLGVRLNVLSDINPRVYKSIIEAHPDVTFYDYTKMKYKPIANNHHYTYSSTGLSQDGVNNPYSNWTHMRDRLKNGDNVAMAFSHKTHLPEHVHDEETGQRFKVINGDSHDFRPLDMQPEGSHGVIIGLKNKKATGEMNKAHIDSNGFFVHYDPQEKMTINARRKPVYEREPSTRISPKTGLPMLGMTIPQNRSVSIRPQPKKIIIPASNDGVENEKE